MFFARCAGNKPFRTRGRSDGVKHWVDRRPLLLHLPLTAQLGGQKNLFSKRGLRYDFDGPAKVSLIRIATAISSADCSATDGRGSLICCCHEHTNRSRHSREIYRRRCSAAWDHRHVTGPVLAVAQRNLREAGIRTASRRTMPGSADRYFDTVVIQWGEVLC